MTRCHSRLLKLAPVESPSVVYYYWQKAHQHQLYFSLLSRYFDENFGVAVLRRFVFCEIWSKNTTVPGVRDGANCMILCSFVSTQYQRETDGWTDTETHRLAASTRGCIAILCCRAQKNNHKRFLWLNNWTMIMVVLLI